MCVENKLVYDRIFIFLPSQNFTVISNVMMAAHFLSLPIVAALIDASLSWMARPLQIYRPIRKCSDKLNVRRYQALLHP